jgi:carboxypeptidase family protein
VPRFASRFVIILGALACTAPAATAQTIAGTVRDGTGAVMPGVTVEAASPALIEKVRTVVTDGTGQYRIVNLSVGKYSVTFSLPGFRTVKREGIELEGNFTATVNADLNVGALEETITVSSASPLVDVQSATRQTVMTRDVIDALPTAHNIQAAALTIPGVTTTATVGNNGRDVGGTTKLQQPFLTFRGSSRNLQRWDGFHLGNMAAAGTSSSFYPNDGAIQELVYSAGTDSADMGNSGIYTNFVPKDGGNSFRGTVYGDVTRAPWSASNLTQRLRDRGITSVTKVYNISDFNAGIGGPIRKDRLWFYAAYRYEALDSSVVDTFYNKSPVWYLYQPDFDRPAHDTGSIPNVSIRLTWQATSKDKVTGWFTHQAKQRPFYNVGGGNTPEGGGRQVTHYAQPMVLKLTRPQTNRLLLEGGFAYGRTYFDNGYREDITPSFDRVAIQAIQKYAITDIANGKTYGASILGLQTFKANMWVGQASANYVTGAHALKAGVEVGAGKAPLPNAFTADMTATYNDGRPQSVTLRIPKDTADGYSPDLQLYIQDRWTFRRATFTGGLRYDYFVGVVNDATLPASRWNPSQSFQGFEVQHWRDLSPRAGVAYDLFGTGRTALKATFARYVDPDAYDKSAASNPQNTIARTDTRTWTDLNGDYSIYNADGSVQLLELGSTSNANFGKVILTNTTVDPATLDGWNARGKTFEWTAGAQHQLTNSLAINAGYYTRYNGNQLVTDNTLITAADFDGPFCITAPRNSLLPSGGGYEVCGLYDITTAARPRVQNNVTFARNFDGITDRYRGFDLGLTMRFHSGTFINAGVNMQSRLLDSCGVSNGRTDNTIDSPEARFCHQEIPYRPDFKVALSHTWPFAIVTSGTYGFTSGPNIVATWNAPNSVIAPALNRNLAAGQAATKTISLIEPGTAWEGYLNQMDARVSKRITVGRYRLRGDFNVYNVFNSDFITQINTTFSTSANSQFRRPTGVLQGRLFKVSGQLEF